MSIRRLGKHVCGPLLAACALVAVLWVGSYRSIAHIKLPVSTGATRWELTSYRGIVSFSLINNHPTSQSALVIARQDTPELACGWDDLYWTGAAVYAGFSVEDSQVLLADLSGQSVSRRWSAVNLPYWLIFSLAAIGPAHGLYVALRAYRRTSHGQCADCGYELGGGMACQACAARAALIGASSRVRLVRPA